MWSTAPVTGKQDDVAPLTAIAVTGATLIFWLSIR